MGTGFLSAIVLSIGISLVDNSRNKKILVFFTYNISSCILAIYQRLLLLIAETLKCESDFEQQINGKDLLQITLFIKQKLSQLNDKLAPFTVSPTGEATAESMHLQENKNELVETVQLWTDSIKHFEERLSVSLEVFEQNKLILIEKYMSDKEYAEIVALVEAFFNARKSGCINIPFYQNINTVIKMLEQVDLSLLDLDGKYNYEYIMIRQMKHINNTKKKDKRK
ncbi:MAG: hypothetical protein ACI4MZ_06940 [Christensenellales bacterium]